MTYPLREPTGSGGWTFGVGTPGVFLGRTPSWLALKAIEAMQPRIGETVVAALALGGLGFVAARILTSRMSLAWIAAFGIAILAGVIFHVRPFRRGGR